MQNQNEIAKINYFLNVMSPLIVSLVKMLLQAAGMNVEQKGSGAGLVFSIRSSEQEAEFHLHNLFLEIATMDRDAEPLRFDERLADFDFLVDKIVRCIQSKLKVFFLFFGEDDMDAAIDKISQDVKNYERIRIWRFDPEAKK